MYRQLKDVSTLLRREHAATVRYFSNTNRAPLNREDTLNARLGYSPVERTSKCSTATVPVSIRFSSTKTLLSSTMGRPRLGQEFSSSMQSVRGFSSSSGSQRFISLYSCSFHFALTYIFTESNLAKGNIARWLKKEGDKVAPGEVLCEVETDKATVEMECMEEGYLAKIVKAEGSKEIQVGEVIAITVEDEEDIGKFKDYTPSSTADAAPPKAEPAPPKAEPAPPPPKEEKVEQPSSPPEPKASKPTASPTGDRVFASPLARKLAEDKNVPLSSIKGTGPEGRIVKADIEDYLASGGKEATAKPSKFTDSKVPALDYVDIPHSQIRKVTASRLAFSKQTIPHYYLTVDACVDKLMGLRSQLNSFQEASGGKRISVNDLVVKAAALALRKVPQCNSSWTDDYIRQFKNVNINVAVQTENGLYVPVVKDADKKGLSTIGEEVRLLAQKAKENSLKPEDYEGGTFTVSNLGGPFGIKQFCAVVNPPQAAILAVGSAEKRVVPGNGPDQFNFASYMPVTLSCDHRVVDGAIGAEWLKAFKGYIENPESMLL
ncbi:unnamed protein product [Thlaspi arvense]|uniref:Acetyltransferase component of pyruvate dehydrogenase complex n=1 Tax=Thlaspi arvense TaxID=13288 RepID=A0AAU9R3X5_THLAR|nr:unnamed protein product [Thlaspi arvense]